MFKFRQIVFFLLFISNLAFANEGLRFLNLYYAKDNNIELSGLHYNHGHLYSVGDKKENHYIYELETQVNNDLKVVPFLDLKKLNNFRTYYLETILFPQFGKWLKSPLDLEGISKCADDFYLVNEQVRHILKITKNSIKKININFYDYFKTKITDPNLIEPNAGFEGIAINCEENKIFIAQERSPRLILVIDSEKELITNHFTIPPSKKDENPDFSALYFENNYLYILERNFYQITKYDLKKNKVVDQISFKMAGDFDLSKLYNTNEPYGLAEGLTMSKEEIFIAFDNNKKPLSDLALKAFKIKGNGPVLLIFERPQGF